MRYGSLFSGAGGLDLAVEAVFGAEAEWHCEIDVAASKVLSERWPGVPNHVDVTRTVWADIEPVDILCGGFPCQDVSAAGRRAGMGGGTRSGLWAIFAEAIDALRPSIVVIENVRGLLSAEANRAMESADATVGDRPGRPVLRAAGAVLGDLADLGYDAQWTTVAAADIGAPHRRERIFIIATDTKGRGLPRLCDENHPQVTAIPSGDGRDEGRPESARFVGRPHAAIGGTGSVDLLPTPVATDAMGSRNNTSGRQPGSKHHAGDTLGDIIFRGDLLPTPNASDGSGGGQHPDKRTGHSRQLIDYALLLQTPSVADGEGGHLNRSGNRKGEMLLPGQAREMVTNWGKYEPAIRRWEQLTRLAPAPTEQNTKGNPRLSARFSEWMMGWPDGLVTDVPGITRNDALRIIGNGVVPQQAVAALQWLVQVSEVA